MGFRSLLVAATLVVPVAVLALGACGGGTDEPSPEPTQPGSEVEPALAESELQIALASSDLSVGLNRVAFGLIDGRSGALKDADVEASTFYLTLGGQEGPIETVRPVFRPWPVRGGVYTAQLSFDRPGNWGIGVVVTEAGGTTRTSSTRLRVGETSLTPAIGSPAPRSATKTANDVDSLEKLTSDLDPDPDLYGMTIAEAIDAGSPLMIAFSTSAYCTTATCGPQLDVVKGLKEEYRDRMSFIHVEIYDNPDEIQGDLSRGRVAPAVKEWDLPSEPWTFIVDRDGLVYAKFEGFATAEELEEALAGVLP